MPDLRAKHVVQPGTASASPPPPLLRTQSSSHRGPKLAEQRVPDYYGLLEIPSSAPSADVKAAYHRALLTHHPDKHGSRNHTVDIGLLQQAFSTLYNPHLRKEYDLLRTSGKIGGPRPAQIVSLEDFEEIEDADGNRWTYPCRCGGQYVVTEDMLDAGQHLVGCASCSEAVWAGYKLVHDGEEDP
ncbi:hypothetical protein C8Q78DRAFT_652729 [Trametes maxima]|nr:hypothetical protein C8Q78DRAFT_652729 [Trametes maxima]